MAAKKKSLRDMREFERTYVSKQRTSHMLQDVKGKPLSNEFLRKPKQECSLEGKCGSCQFFDSRPESKSSVGYPCINPEKRWKYSTSRYKYRTTPACRKYAKKVNASD